MNARWIAREGPVAIREMQNTEHDFRLMLRWMTDPQTMRYWEGMQEIYTYERVAREFAESLAEGVTPCIIAYAGTEIGYCQFCTLRRNTPSSRGLRIACMVSTFSWAKSNAAIVGSVQRA